MGDSNKNLNVDARVVQTVRNLKKLPSRHSDNSDSSASTNNQNVNSIEKSEEEKDKKYQLQKSDEIKSNQADHLDKDLINSKSNPLTKSLSMKRNPSVKEKPMKILIDGEKGKSEKKKTESNKNLIHNKPIFSGMSSFNTNNYKTKSEFQKRLMNDNNINKYKNMCIGLLKDDDELKKLSEICGYGPNMFETLLEESFFSDKVFLYKLEVLLSSDSNLNKLKKEKFFKEEIKSRLELKSYEILYEKKINKLNFAIDTHIRNIQNFDFFN